VAATFSEKGLLFGRLIQFQGFDKLRKYFADDFALDR
jgi:hypothetical protein